MACCGKFASISNNIIMKTIRLKTNIKCDGCVAKITPELNKAAGENNWKVDTQNPDKILNVSAENVNENEVIKAVERAGFNAEKIV